MKETSLGNYFGYYKGYYVFIYKRPHGSWCCRYGKNGEWINQEGYHGTSLRTIKKAIGWAKGKIQEQQ